MATAAKRAVNDRQIWMIATGGAVVAITVVLALFRLPSHASLPEDTIAAAPKSIGFRVLKEADTTISLLDPTPLFLPTELNARPNALPPDAVREPGSTFKSYPPQRFFDESMVKLTFPPTGVNIPAKPIDSLEAGPIFAAFSGMGQTKRSLEPLPGRDAFVEVIAESSGARVLTEALHNVRVPGDVDWQPVGFLVSVGPAGLVGQPMLVGAGSGFEQVDAFFQNYLARVLRIGERVAPGFYRIKIGP